MTNGESENNAQRNGKYAVEVLVNDGYTNRNNRNQEDTINEELTNKDHTKMKTSRTMINQ